MSHDLVSLTMMVIGMTGPERELWREGATMSSIPVEFSICDPAAGIAALGNGGADICIVDGTLPEPATAAALTAAKALRSAPHVFICADRNDAGPAGVTATFGKPANAEAARQMVERCLRTRVPTRVLVVDDSSTMRSIVRKILSASRYLLDLHEAGEGRAALARLRQESFGIVFLDHNMPGLDGVTTLCEIKRETPDVAVVMMTTTVEEPVVERAMTAGALGFLKKPFYPADIDRVLDRYYGFTPA